MDNNFKETLESFIAECQTLVTDKYKVYSNVLLVKYGKKYAKIITSRDGVTVESAWAFINISNGDILKPASWSAPAKHARGNIYNDNRMQSVDAYGPNYL